MRLIIVLTLLVAHSIAQTGSTKTTTENAELNQMYKVDQSEREGPNVDWTALYHHDVERRARLHTLLAEGRVQTAADYFHAAMIYQHGQTPDDYLLAHLLAVSAIIKGSKEARWLSAATMDRYLRSIWQPQVYGTQFTRTSDKEPWSHATMNEQLLSDAMRSTLCVLPLTKQKQDSANTAKTSADDCQ